MLVAQDGMEVTVFRRAAQWAAEVLTKPLEELTLPSIKFKLGLSAVYDGVKV